MKNIYIIGGTMGVGKITVCQELKKQLHGSVFLDGDWCWDADPFVVTEETKAMVMDNICHMLNNFIKCTAYENVIFCWVMHEQSIIDDILSKIEHTGCKINVISLVCNEENLYRRLKKDVVSGLRQNDIISRSIARIPLYNKLDTIKIDTSDKTVQEIVSEILNI